MIDQATGMKPGERYRVENVERAHQFPGFFQDGKYYLGPELLTAVGWLEGTRFIYDSLDAEGEPVFPNREAGIIEGLTLTLVDGTALGLCRVEASETLANIDASTSGTNDGALGDSYPIKGPLRGKVVVITGASSGIGRAAAHAFACKGARLVLAARDEEALFDVLDECTDCGTDAIATITDVTRNDHVQALAEQAAEFGHGRIDIWINNAGVGAVGNFEETPLEAHEQVIQTDLIGYLRGACRPSLLQGTGQRYSDQHAVAGQLGGPTLCRRVLGEQVRLAWTDRGIARRADCVSQHTCLRYLSSSHGHTRLPRRRQLHRTYADTARPRIRSREGGKGYGDLRNITSGSHHRWSCSAHRAFGQLPDTRAASVVREADALGDKSQPRSRSIIRQPLRASKWQEGYRRRLEKAERYNAAADRRSRAGNPCGFYPHTFTTQG